MKGVMLHATLSLLGLLFAYQTWTREAEVDAPPGEVTLAQCTAAQFGSIEIESEVHRVVARRKPTKAGVEYWVRSERKTPEAAPEIKPKPDATATKNPAVADTAGTASAAKTGAVPNAIDAAKSAPEKPAESAPKQARPYDPNAPTTFLANAEFDALIKTITPLRAVRGLGALSKNSEAAFGFGKAGIKFRLECGGAKTALEFGGRSFGKSDQYVRDMKTKQVYLLEGQLAADLQSGFHKFMQSKLHSFSLTDVDEAVISALGKQRRLLHRNRLVPEEARWVDAAAPDKRNELFGNWFELIEKLNAKGYMAEGAKPGADLQIATTGTVPLFTVDYRLEGKSKGKVEVVRVDTAQEGFYYLRSEATHGWVTTYDSVAKQVEDDLAMVVGAEAAAAVSPVNGAAATPALPTPSPAAAVHP